MTLQTGEALSPEYYRSLSGQLQRVMEQYGLGIQATEVLTQWASTVTENPSQSISERATALKNGLKDLSTIILEPEAMDAALIAVLQSNKSVRLATVSRKPGKPAKMTVWLTR